MALLTLWHFYLAHAHIICPISCTVKLDSDLVMLNGTKVEFK